jgi:hypothetical protein
MKCDSCGTVVKTGTAICPKCDAILDAGAFSDAPPPPDAESSIGTMKPRASSGGVKKVKKATTGSAPTVPRKKEDAASKYGKMMPPAPPRLLKPDPSEVKEDIDWRQTSVMMKN